MAASPSRKPDDSDSRLERFRTFTVAHPRLVEAKEALVNAIRGAEPNSLIFVFGPTGVGKTTLRLKTEQLVTCGNVERASRRLYPDSSSQCGSRSSRVRQF
jgi:predicted AAA+ superfamily ATPase